MYCKYCGAANADGGNFCQSCGKPLFEEAPAYSEPAYSQPAYSEPVYAQPVYAQPEPVAQPKNLVAKIMGLVALTLFIMSFIMVLYNGADPSPILILELLAFLMLGVGLWLPGIAGRVVTGISPLILSIVALGSLLNTIDIEAELQTIGFLLQLLFILSGIGILVRVKGMIIGGAIPALVGCVFSNILFYAVRLPYVFELPEIAAMIVLIFLAYVFACITLLCYRPKKR